jgi:GNAT superfamily N-acetyltransferase
VVRWQLQMRYRDPIVSVLLKKRWSVPNVGKVSVEVASRPALSKIDGSWPKARFQADYNHSWVWMEIARERAETFVLLGEGDVPIGIWSSSKRRPIKLPEGRFYRLDFFESAPQHRGKDFGVFLLSVIATRAIELGAIGVILGTWEPLRPFYLKVGAKERAPGGWNLAPNLVPFTLESALLETMATAIAEIEYA